MVVRVPMALKTNRPKNSQKTASRFLKRFPSLFRFTSRRFFGSPPVSHLWHCDGKILEVVSSGVIMDAIIIREFECKVAPLWAQTHHGLAPPSAVRSVARRFAPLLELLMAEDAHAEDALVEADGLAQASHLCARTPLPKWPSASCCAGVRAPQRRSAAAVVGVWAERSHLGDPMQGAHVGREVGVCSNVVHSRFAPTLVHARIVAPRRHAVDCEPVWTAAKC